jgi:hypothetical protein
VAKAKKRDLSKLWLISGNILLLLPAVGYWTSALMSAVYGTDYFYDEVFAQLKTNISGTVVLGFILTMMPTIALIVDLKYYEKRKKKN